MTLPAQGPSIWSIQEIVDLISKFLDPSSILQCAQVSKAWHAAWLPSLWARIEPDHWGHAAFLAALPAHGDLIRVLKCSRYDELELLGPNATRLSWLKMPKTTLLNMHHHIRVLQQNQDSLQTLSVILNDVESVSHQFLPLLKTIRQLRSLKTLRFDGSLCLDEAALEYVLGGQRPVGTSDDSVDEEEEEEEEEQEQRHSSPIQELSLSEISFFRHPFNHGENFASKEYIARRQRRLQQQQQQYEDEEEDKTEEVQETRRPFTKITSLLLHEVNCNPELVLNLTSRFPMLQRLSLRGASEFYPEPTSFPETLARHCPHLRHLDISRQETLTDDFIASLIRLFPHLTTLKASDTLFSEESMQTLVDHCRDLIRLEIAGCYNISSTTFQRFLCQCSTLRHLDAWDSTLNAVEMVASFFWRSNRGVVAGGAISTNLHYAQHQHQHLGYKDPACGDSSKLSSTKATASASTTTTTTSKAGMFAQGGWWACARSLESLTLDIVYQPWSRGRVRQFLEDLKLAGFGQQQQQMSSSLAAAHSDGDSEDWTTTTNLAKIGLLLMDKKHARNVAYQQLGQLVNIRSLFVGGYELEPVYQVDEEVDAISRLSLVEGVSEQQPWIDFSLASGLDHLRSLKRLSEISFIRIGQPPEHHVEQAELEWMLQHWPNLRKIEGLDQRNEDEEEGVFDDEPVNELVTWLHQKRPDIIIDEEFF